jgi:hypothetical protein
MPFVPKPSNFHTRTIQTASGVFRTERDLRWYARVAACMPFVALTWNIESALPVLVLVSLTAIELAYSPNIVEIDATSQELRVTGATSASCIRNG